VQITRPVPASTNISLRFSQNRPKLWSVSLRKLSSSQGIVMASPRTRLRISRVAFAAPTLAGALWAGAAFASQGPGAGPGTASSFTQWVMAVIVYGTSALVVGAGLIGAMRRPRRFKRD
jgi:hypothetical protein